MRVLTKALLLSAGSIALSGSASAALLDFSLTGSYQAHFRIDSNPTAIDPDINGFEVDGVFNRNTANTAFINYPGSTSNVADLIFYSTDNGNLGGFEIDDNYSSTPSQLLVTDGAQLYTGTSAAPTFKTGIFQLTESFGGAGRYTLVISQVAAAVPEPSTWALAILGFGAVGCAMRRSSRNVSVRFAA